VALYVQILTDNRNRAASDVRSTFTRNNGNLGEPGSVGYLFSQKGMILAKGTEDDVMLAALDAGALRLGVPRLAEVARRQADPAG
jgi:transcriptional/translational regulatory protein YebC/TACO1